MYDTAETLLQTKGVKFYKTVLLFYPKSYTKRFGEQILIIFQDMYQEEVSKHGKAGLRFWFSIFLDTIQSMITEHVYTMKEQGIKKYFHINNYNILGSFLLLPFILIFAYGMIGRIVQGDLNRYNRSFEGVLSHSFIYANYFGKPLLLMAIAIIFPVLAVLINLVPIIALVSKAKKLSLSKLFLANPIAVLIIIVGSFFLMIIFGHDFVPCTIHGIMRFGFGQLGHIVSVCKKA